MYGLPNRYNSERGGNLSDATLWIQIRFEIGRAGSLMKWIKHIFEQCLYLPG
jgi:hypothetical protein